MAKLFGSGAQYERISKAQHPEAALAQGDIAPTIPLALLGNIMDTTVDLQNKPDSGAVEVGNVLPHNCLSVEPQASASTISERLPRTPLDRSRFRAKLSGAI
jgi:hypothetical protein